MKIMVTEFPEQKEDCLFKKLCPIYEFCNNTKECAFMELYDPDKDDKEPIEKKVTNLLLKLGADIANSGFQVTVDLVSYIEKYRYGQSSSFTQLYEISGATREKNWMAAERSVRYLIKNIIEKDNRDMIEKVFGTKYVAKQNTLRVKQFVYSIHNYIKNN